MFSNVLKKSKSALSDLNPEEIAECSRFHKARIASFLNGLKDKPLNTRFRKEILKMNVF